MRNFGYSRVMEPEGFVPVAAWKLDNSKNLNDNEIRIKIKSIKFEEGNFRQLCNACDYDEDSIKRRVLDLIKKRGKLHNPSTDSGGICYGIVDRIGEKFNGKEKLTQGDQVICISSLTSFPVFIESIGKINFNYGQMEVEGYAIIFETNPIIPVPKNINLSCALSAFDESGSVARAYYLAEKGKKFLLLGSGLFSVLLYAAAIRKAVGKNCRIVAVIDRESTSALSEEEMKLPLAKYIDALYTADILSPLETYEWIVEKEIGDTNNNEELFDVSINCANLLGAETISVLLTKDHGSLFFTNLINNYNLVLLFAESLGKNINTISLEEYSMGFPEFTTKLLGELKSELDAIDGLYRKYPIISKLPTKITELIRYRQVAMIDDYIYCSKKTKEMLEKVLNIALYDCNLVIQGETGVGKEKILELIHKNSSRKMNPCIKINCASVQETLAESEFFGYESGAFTGANQKGKQGYFQLANNGILFLDEVSELPLSLQAKLLRVLQENQFYKVGGENPIKVNVRVICASNKSLRQEVKEGRFREDLYNRLNICEINIPPLRERTEDIPCLAEHFINKYNERYALNKKLSYEALGKLIDYPWLGNVRELDNTIHRSAIISKGNTIDEYCIAEAINSNLYRSEEAGGTKGFSEMQSISMRLESIMAQHERTIIDDTLKREGTTRKAAEALGISQSQLMRKKSKYGL